MSARFGSASGYSNVAELDRMSADDGICTESPSASISERESYEKWHDRLSDAFPDGDVILYGSIPGGGAFMFPCYPE
jgi:hypothetical protein